LKRFRNILYIMSLEEHDDQALERAVSLAENNQAELRVLAAVDRISVGMGMPEGGPISAQLQAALVQEGEKRLRAAVEVYRGRIEIEATTVVGVTFLEVIHEILSHDHDLLIKVAENPEWLNRLFGSNDMHLLRKCPCPVWLLRPDAPARFHSILAAVDLDDAYAPSELEVRRGLNEKILMLAASLAVGDFAALHVGHSWEAIGENLLRKGMVRAPGDQVDRYVEEVRAHRQQSLEHLLERVLADADVNVLQPQVHLVKGAPRETIPALARTVEADLVVMGTVARTGIPGIIVGNTAEMVLSQIECSVLAVKPTGFVSPVTLPS
jgi:nucleotide-binding universal stress UspA family protein